MYYVKGILKFISPRLGSAVFSALFMASILIFSSSCNTVPDYISDNRTIPQLVEYLKTSGLKIDKIFPNVRYQAILASDGVVMVIDGARVEFYIYDMSKPYQKRKLDKIRKNKEIVVLGRHVPCITNGRFIMMTYSDNPNKIRAMKVFKNFKLNEKK